VLSRVDQAGSCSTLAEAFPYLESQLLQQATQLPCTWNIFVYAPGGHRAEPEVLFRINGARPSCLSLTSHTACPWSTSIDGLYSSLYISAIVPEVHYGVQGWGSWVFLLIYQGPPFCFALSLIIAPLEIQPDLLVPSWYFN
jgi:hypothetical protein